MSTADAPATRCRLAVLISGRGSNMLELADACRNQQLAAEIVLVASDRDAPGLARAGDLGLQTTELHYRDFADKAAFETALHEALTHAGAELVCLAGFMRVLSADFVARWEGRILNIHPSLLPSFPGLDTHARALAAGATLHGATVHVVTAELDAGPIIAQAAIRIRPDDDAESLAARLLPVEHQLYPHALRVFLETASRTQDDDVFFSPPLSTQERQAGRI